MEKDPITEILREAEHLVDGGNIKLGIKCLRAGYEELKDKDLGSEDNECINELGVILNMLEGKG